MMNPLQNKPVIIAAITIVAAYFVLIMLVLASQTTSIWDTENGIGAWTGTAEEMEGMGFDNILNNNIGFIFFLVIIPSLIITGWIIQDKTMKSKFLMIIGIVLMIEGFLVTIYSSFILFPPTEPPIMRPLGNTEYVFYMYKQVFLLSGIIGIFVTIAGIMLWIKRK